MKIICCMKIVEKDRSRTKDISGHSLGRGDRMNSGHVQLRAQDELTPDGPGQVFSWIVWLFGFLFVPFIGVVDVSSRFPSPEYKIVPDVLAISCE